MGNNKAAYEITKHLKKIQSYDKKDWLFLAGDVLMDNSITLNERFAILDILKRKQNITAEDLISLGFFTEETRYNSLLLGLFKYDIAAESAALLELSYRLTRYDTTILERELDERHMRAQQQFALLYFLGTQTGLNGVQAYNAAGSAIRMNGASVAVPGYESVPSDYHSFNWTAPSEELVDRIMNAPRTGSATKLDVIHRSSSYLSKEQLMGGRYYSVEGADGKKYMLLQVKSQLNDNFGIFEYILDSNGHVTHQRFIINGIYTGTPNQ